jgi:hypothetical protein
MHNIFDGLVYHRSVSLNIMIPTSVPELALAVAFVVVLLYDYVLTFGMEASLLRSWLYNQR